MQPDPYVISTDFSQEEASGVAGRSTVRTAAVDTEFVNLQTTISQILANLALIQRDDGNLLDGLVNIPTLSTSVLALMASGTWTVRGPWFTVTDYALGDVVLDGGLVYLCTIAHTSNVFATDLAAGNWGQITASPAAGAVSFSPTATLSAVTVQGAIEELDTELRPSIAMMAAELFYAL